MPKTKTTSPARSEGGITTPKRKTTRTSRSLCSPALSTASGRLTSLVDQFKDKNMESFALSPLNGRSVLNDNTEIEEPRRKSWWKKLDENSQDVLEVLEDNRLSINNTIEEFIDIEVISQEKKNYTLDLPESSDNESIQSIVLPQRRLFTQKENQPQKKYVHLIDNRESLAKLHKTNTANIDKTINVGTRELFQNAKRSKPIFPAALLTLSPNKTTADKTMENVFADPKPQVRNIFGNRPANKRKNIFADFIVSESEDEIPEIQPKVFTFQKKLEQRRISSISKGRDASPASSITTDIEMDFRMLLPSSTMVENQLEDHMLVDNTPIKRARLSKLSEAKESEAGTLQTNTTSDKTKQSNKSVASKNKSKASPELKDKSLNSSRITRSMLKNTSKRDENVNTSVNPDAKGNKSRSKISSKDNELDASPSKSVTHKQSATLNKSQKQNKSRTMNSPKAIETLIESEEIVVHAINNVTRVINKSTNKSLPNTTATNKSVNEKERTVTMKVDDEDNFKLEYESDEVLEEAEVHNDLNENQKDNTTKLNTVALEKDSQETEINKSKSNKSILTNKSFQQKPAKIVEESVESQTEQYSADDNVDGNQEQETENVQNKDEEMINEEIGEDANNSRGDISDGKVIEENGQEIEVEVNVSQDNEEEANESEENKEEVNVSHENEEEMNGSQEKAVNERQEVENEISEGEDEEEANESDENEDEANVSDVNEDEANESQEVEVNESQEIEEEANESQEVEAEVNESQDVEEETNESQEIEEEANESQKIEAEATKSQEIEEEANDSQEIEAEASESQEDEEEANESQEDEEEANESQEDEEEANESKEDEEEANESQEDEEEAKESQEIENEANEGQEVEIDEEAHESQELVDAHVSDEEMNEDEEEAANESQINETSANESQEVQNDEKESHEVASEAESAEVENDQQMDDSDEADKAIASDPEISDDNQADEMEVDGDEEQESDNESEQNEHESHEGKQIEEQNEIEPSEEIEEPPDVTHDTTGRHRQKDLNKSPEVILHDNTKSHASFTAKGRNTSVRKTKSMIKNLNIRPSLAPSRDSVGFSDGTTNSSAEGSGWDSHRVTRKTLRQTFGKDFTPRKSLRVLVMEKSAKRQTEHLEMHSESVKFPLANSTEMPEDSNHHVEDIVESDHEVSRRMRQTTLELYLQKIKEQNIEKNLKMEAAIRNSFKNPVTNSLSLFKVPNKPAPRRPKPAQSKPKKQLKSIIPFDELPSEVIEDMKYKPPKRFQPTNASWITKRLYKFLENKLEAKYDYKARVRAEKLVETIYYFAKDIRRHHVAPTDAVDVLKHELARLDIVRTHFEFYEFFHEFMPREVRIKVVPDIVNKIALPRHGVFSDILRVNAVHG